MRARSRRSPAVTRLRRGLAMLLLCLGVSSVVVPPAVSAGQRNVAEDLDRVLDLFVRDGLVYYNALRTERAVVERYLASLREPRGLASWDADAQKAFWLNAYNAIVLKLVLDHYPIRGTAAAFPPNSVRQIPGAFDQLTTRVAGRDVTLDQIESEILSGFGDPRLFLALGRGAVDSGRLRSELYRGGQLDAQLGGVVREFATTQRHVWLNQPARRLRVSAIFGWREHEFVQTYAERDWTDSGRSPLERAILTVVEPELFPTERQFLRQNDFVLDYHEFDWRLNDLTGGRPSNR